MYYVKLKGIVETYLYRVGVVVLYFLHGFQK